MTSPLLEIFTDGACRGNPGPGGWAALIRVGSTENVVSGAEPATTNNRMEVMAAIEALRSIAHPSRIRLTTDSEYLRQGITNWMKRWKLNGWRTAAKQPVKNKDLWMVLDSLVGAHQIEWCWVKGHSGHAENELVDAAANLAIDALLAGRSAAGSRSTVRSSSTLKRPDSNPSTAIASSRSARSNSSIAN